MSARNVIACDLDGVLAVDLPRTQDDDSIGPAVPEMLQRVKDWVTNGEEVWIFTARLSHPDPDHMTMLIQDWCEENGLPRLPVTNRKSGRIAVYYDDRAVAVVPNAGHLLNEPQHTEDEER